MSESIAAVNADVVWRTNSKEATVDIEKLRRTFHESTQSMSTDALKLASAQDRLDRALIKHGASSKQARDAEIALRKATQESTVSAERHSSALRSEERNLERLGRGAIVGSGAVRGLARSVAFASTSFLGGAGLVFALKKSVDAFREHQTIVARVSNAVRRAGLDYRAHAVEIDRVIQAQSRLSAFDDEKLLDTFGRLVVRTKDINEALRLNALAADVARGRNIDLEAATQLVIKASIGQAGQLRRLGIDVSKTATAQQLLAALQERYSGAAARFAQTDEGIAQRRQKSLQDLEEIIGRGISPAIDRLDRRFIKWAENDDNLRRVQHDVNEAVRVGGQVAHGLARGFDTLHDAAAPVVHVLGGVEKTAKLALEAMAVYKLLKIAGAIRGVGVQWGFVATQANAAAAAEERAAGAGAGAGLGTVGGRAVGDLGRETARRALPIGFGAGSVLVGAAAGATLALASRGESSVHVGGPLDVSVGPSTIVTYRDPVTGKYVITTGYAGKSAAALDRFLKADIRKRHPEVGLPPGQSPIGENALGNRPPAGTSGTGGGGRTGRKHGFELPYNLQLEAARAAAGQGSELGAAQDALRYVKAQLAAGRLNKQGVLDALSEEAQLEDQIDGILDARDAKREARRKQREAAEKKRREAALKRDEAYGKQLLHDAQYLKAQRLRRKHQLAQTAKSEASSGGVGLGDVSDLFRTYGSNLFGPGAAGSPQDAIGMLAELVRLQREGNKHTKTTAGNTAKIFMGPNPAKVAAHLADVGAWT